MVQVESAMVRTGDVDNDFYWSAMSSPWLAWDIETSGLAWSEDRIGTCQVAMPGRIIVVQLRPEDHPKRLMSLLESPDVVKVFHHAPFDLRFMTAQWEVEPRNVACTKVASKILEPWRSKAEHSLKPVLQRHLGIQICKDEQTSDWLAGDLTPAQIAYAARDVAYLIPLAHRLLRQCQEQGVEDLLLSSWAYLPTRVQLDLAGAGDVFDY